MTKTAVSGMCIGDVRLCSIDVGFDARASATPITLPEEFTSVGLDGRDGQRYLVTGTREEMVAAIKDEGYQVAE